jgi:hypothetical protein
MQTVKLNLIPGSVLPVVNVSQYDKTRQFALQIYEGATAYSLTGKDVQIRGTKPDGNGFAYDEQDGVVSVSGNTVTISTTQQMTAVGGQTMAELRITSGDTILGTLNFVLMVEPSALSDDTPISDTEIPVIERDFEAALEEAEADALKAEGYAVGTQEGVPAQSGEPYYQDNAKYYKEQAEAAASGGGADALKAEGYAVGTQNGVPVTSGSPYYHNNAAYYEGEASTSATNAATSETNAGLSETAAGNSATSAAADALEAEGWANGKQNGTPVGPGSPYYQDNAEYYKDQAAQYAAGGLIFQGSVAFASIPTTGMANGDMYNITDDFTTDSRFIEGAGVSVKAGADIAWVAGSVNKWDILALGGGSDDYSQLINKPQINSVELDGNKTTDELGLATDAAMTGASAGSAGAKGLVPAPAAGDQDKVLCGDGTWKTPSSGSDMTGATASTPGTHGLVPAPAAGDNTKFLRGDGTWAEAGGGGGGGFDYKDWLTAGDLNPMSYADLAAVLADEKAVRKLMTIHLAVDYLAGQTAVDASINTILTDNVCAKWINLRDYALDTLYDNALFKTVMDAAGKYFLGEWAKLSTSPETWGPKGNVPIMTSNIAPYGTASAYQVFDGNSATTASGTDFSYKFVNPICPKDFICKNTSGQDITGGTLQASNDGSTWAAPVDGEYYLNLRVHFAASTTVATVQFYGRELKVSVPVMTSNTAPYGVASASSEANSNYYAFHAVNGVSTVIWGSSQTPGKDAWWKYQFPTKICPKFFKVRVRGAQNITYTFKIQILVGNEYVDISDPYTVTMTDFLSTGVYTGDAILPAINPSLLSGHTVRMQYTGTSRTDNYFNATDLQIYGEDYSEYDWDADNPRHYLYDHGVELETLTYYAKTNACIAENSMDELYVYVPNSTGVFASIYTSAQINATNYNTYRCEVGKRMGENGGYLAASTGIPTNSDTYIVQKLFSANAGAFNPTALGVDISAVNQNVYFEVADENGSVARVGRFWSVSSLWLE